MLRALFLIIVAVTAAVPAAAQDYQSQDLAEAAAQYRQDLIDAVPAEKRQPGLISRLREDAEAEYQAKRYAQAIEDLGRAIAYGADDGRVWLSLAQSLAAGGGDHVLAAAYNAYLKSTDPVERGHALFLIGADYDRHDQPKDALVALEAGFALTPSTTVGERIAQLKRLVAFRVTKVQIEAEADEARACLRFNEKVATKGDVAYGEYVRSEPNIDGIVTARNDTLCLNGLKHGEIYEVELLAGFPADTGEKLAETFQTRLVVPDRQPSISFSGAGYVLPRDGSAGLPVTTVNLDRVKVKVLQINRRNLVPALDADKLTLDFDRGSVDEIINHSGKLVWEGEMSISGERNRVVRTAIPLKDRLRDNGPGVYLAVVERADVKPGDQNPLATNWVLVSNLGLTAYSGTDGIAIAVRSLADAKPIPGVALRLYARNNSELATATTGPDGIAHIPGGLVRGQGGDEPFAVMAYGPGGDFNFLELGRAAFDLSDRGVSGRPQPGPVDAYLYTDRGIYRPGESVHLTMLVRDDKAEAIANLPLTLRLLHPDGVETDRRQLTGGRLGGYQVTYALARDARIGTWRAELKVDPQAAPIGTIEFRVEDFVPPQLKVALTAPDRPVVPDQPFPVAVAAQYYFGAPGAGLSIDAEATVAYDDDPFPGQPGFHFGLVDEAFSGKRYDVDSRATDADGKATATLQLAQLPDLTRPLAATVRVSVMEPSGRAVSASVTRPIAQRSLAIGLRSPADDEAVPEGQPARVDVIAVDAAGKRIAAKGLRWELLRETWQYEWYAIQGNWRSRLFVHDQPLAAGTLDVGAEAPALLTRIVPAGRYRWEVSDGASGAQSSLRFHVGWWVEAALPDVPDKLDAVLDKQNYRPGDTAKLFVKAPFAGEAELAIAADRVLAWRSFVLPAGGTTIEIPVARDWGSGVYALVSAYRAADLNGAVPSGPRQHGPGRAVGVAWLGIDPAPHTLAVSLAAPAVVRPRGPVDVPIKVSGLAPGEEAYVTLATVDEAVLKLTEFDSPAPEKYFYGKRQLGVELRDLYGRLIDPRATAIGTLRSGGDQFAKRSVAGLPDRSSRVVALFSGIVKLDANGAAKIPFTIPDFQGQLRLMAVAFSANRLGSASTVMAVRDPVVTLVSLPRFLAPGDTARIGVVINNLEGPAGKYRLKLSASGAGTLAAPVERLITLAGGQSVVERYDVAADAPGTIALSLELSGPDAVPIARAFTVGVRPAQAYQLRRFVGRLEPGQSVTLDDGPAGAFLPGTGEALLTVSPRPDWDVPGLLRALDRYAYGCLEQTTSRALPLLYVETVAKLWHDDLGFDPAATLDGAIGHVVELQRSDGSFGVWNDTDDTVPWLDAYATDFLLRAREHGKNVPDFAIHAALGWLRDYVRQDPTDPETLPAVAYAHYVLARARADDLAALRYFNDTQLDRLPSQLAKAQLAAALTLYGDAGRASAAYAEALGAPAKRPSSLRFIDYGSDLRDSAGVLSFAAGDPDAQPRLTAVMDRIAELFANAGRTSTQEQAWLLMAAETAARISGDKMTIARDKGPPQTGTQPLYVRRKLGAGAAPTVIINRGTAPVWRTVSITGVAKDDLPEESKGYTVARTVYHRDGTPANLAEVRQGDLLVVVIKGTRAAPKRAARALVVDLLPAGFEIETAAAAAGDKSAAYPWLNKTTETTYAEARDDRYIAALDLGAGTRDFTLAYVVRAVTPGAFAYPAAVAEDMYEPEITGRTAIGKLVVSAR
ncbi:MAG TPA: MG2 domain-containing protein [Stellaceae bacterium]|nr:MG2 domain-containing protein [Stellaceae bacterium]